MRTARRLVAALLLLAAPAIADAQGRPVGKIVLSESGAIQFDDRPVTLSQLRSELAKLAAAKGEVWYYRPNPGGEPPPGALAVIDAIIAARVPVRLATRPDFSAFDAPGSGSEP